MKEIKLTRGKVALVDDDDFERLDVFKWHAYKEKSSTGDSWHARRNVTLLSDNGVKYNHSLHMHREVFRALAGDPRVDHIDGDGLNNQKHNLRLATPSQNMQNRTKQVGCTSNYKGVSWNKKNQCWQAKVTVAHKQTHLGLFDSEINAAHAYNTAARKYFKEYARPNNIPVEATKDTRKPPPASSKFRGVAFIKGKKTKQWAVHISVKNKTRYIGCYDTETEAAKAYNAAAVECHGDKAKLNNV